MSRRSRGSRKQGPPRSNLLKYIVFGRTDENNTIRVLSRRPSGRDGRLAIADLGCSCVHLYVPSEQKYRKIYSAGQKELRSPVSVVFDDASRLYVSDSVLARYTVFDRAGNYLFSIRKAGNDPLQRPTGLSYSARRKTFVRRRHPREQGITLSRPRAAFSFRSASRARNRGSSIFRPISLPLPTVACS